MAEHTTWLSWGTAVAGVAIALAAPVLGARADASGRRRLWLGINTTVVVVLSALLVLINPDATNQAHQVMIGVGLLSLGNIFFELASVNYNAMLNQISTPTIGDAFRASGGEQGIWVELSCYSSCSQRSSTLMLGSSG